MSNVTPERLRAEAVARTDRALALIERAQHDLERACAELSSLIGGIPVWKATSSHTDKVRALWWRVHRFRNRGRFRLDDTHVAALIKRETTAQQTGTQG